MSIRKGQSRGSRRTAAVRYPAVLRFSANSVSFCGTAKASAGQMTYPTAHPRVEAPFSVALSKASDGQTSSLSCRVLQAVAQHMAAGQDGGACGRAGGQSPDGHQRPSSEVQQRGQRGSMAAPERLDMVVGQADALDGQRVEVGRERNAVVGLLETHVIVAEAAGGHANVRVCA